MVTTINKNYIVILKVTKTIDLKSYHTCTKLSLYVVMDCGDYFALYTYIESLYVHLRLICVSYISRKACFF